MSDTKGKDEMREEYDFSQGVRGKHANALRNGHTTLIHKSDGSKLIRETRAIILEPDLQDRFPDSEAVNRALRELIKIKG